MIQKDVERRALIMSSIVNLIMAVAGIWVFMVTNIQALFLDGVFSLIGFASAVAAVIISKISQKRTGTYPDGLYFMEPLYAICKSLLTLALLVISLQATAVTAYDYFYHGIGEAMNISPVLPYTIGMVILCFGLSIYNKYQNKKINNTSTILSAESKSNVIDGLLSLGVGAGIVLLYFIDINGPLGFLHYTGDFFITAVLFLLSLKVPVVVLIQSFIELSNGVTKDQDVKKHVSKALNTHLGTIIEKKKYDIFKVGMLIKVRISLPEKIKKETLEEVTIARERIMNELNGVYDNVEITFEY